jgi:hypothetical protein
MTHRDDTAAPDDSIDTLLQDADAHSLADVAAAVARRGWDATRLGGTLQDLIGTLERRAVQDGDRLGDRLAGALDGSLGDAVSTGARLGFALALTSSASARGCAAWLAEVHSGLAAAGCSLEEHNAPRADVVRALLDELRATPGGRRAPALQPAGREEGGS